MGVSFDTFTQVLLHKMIYPSTDTCHNRYTLKYQDPGLIRTFLRFNNTVATINTLSTVDTNTRGFRELNFSHPYLESVLLSLN